MKDEPCACLHIQSTTPHLLPSFKILFKPTSEFLSQSFIGRAWHSHCIVNQSCKIICDGRFTWISSSSSSSCLGLMMICVLTLASSLSSSRRALASEASEDNSAVVTFKSRNLFRSSQAFKGKESSLIYTGKIISKEINYIWKVFILRIPLRFQVFRNFSLLRSYFQRFEFCIES